MRFLGDVFAVLVLMTCGAWLLVTSEVFVRYSGVELQGHEVSALREMPMGAVKVRYVETVRPILQDYHAETLCVHAPPRPLDYPAQGGTTDLARVAWSIGQWASPCMRGDFLWRAEWYVQLFGLIPLRPAEVEVLVRS